MGTKRDVVKKGGEGSIKAVGLPQSKLDKAKARLPEPQDRAGFVLSGGNDGDTHSALDRRSDGRDSLSPSKGRILTYQGQRSERGA
jgi:hypothetical protein